MSTPATHKFQIDLEGTIHPWDKPTITTEQIAALGGWDVSLGVVEIDKDNVERTLSPGQVVEIRPGHGFSKKVRWKRGAAISERMQGELDLLRCEFDEVQYDSALQWVLLRPMALPADWNRTNTDVAFQVPPAYPGTPPYGFYVPAGLRYRQSVPSNYTEPAGNQPPFGGAWGMFSWGPSDGKWRATVDPRRGANLVSYARSFNNRFLEGA